MTAARRLPTTRRSAAAPRMVSLPSNSGVPTVERAFSRPVPLLRRLMSMTGLGLSFRTRHLFVMIREIIETLLSFAEL